MRTLYGLGVVAAVLLGLPLVQGDWLWLGFVVIVSLELLRKVLSGIFLGRRRGVNFSFLGVPRVFDVVDVYAVELLQPAKLTYVRLWFNDRDRPWAVIGPQYWRRPGQARGLAVSLTTGLNERGGNAGFYDAVRDEWVIPPAQVEDESAE